MNEEYILGELEVMPQMVKNNYLRIIKELVKEKEFADEKEKIDSLVQQGNIDLFLKTVWEQEKNLFLRAKFQHTLLKGFKYGALFRLEDDRDLDVILKQISNLSAGDDIIEVVCSHKMVIVTNNLDGIKLSNTVEHVKTTHSIVVKFWEVSQQEKFVEVNVANIGTPFRQNNPNFFTEQIDQIVSKLQDEYLLSLDPLDFSEVINSIKERSKSETAAGLPQASAQKMILSSGAEATLDSNNTEEIILPILGELKQLIEENTDVFDNSPEIKELLSEFIQDTEALSDFPWVALTWDHVTKSKRIKVKFVLDSSNSYTLLNYYSHTNGRKELNNVVESILKEYCAVRNSQNSEELSGVS